MPNAPGRKCSKCRGGIVRKGKCNRCEQQSQATYAQDDSRGDRNALYGADWREARKYKLIINPLCEPCEKRGLARVADQVHHIRSFQGKRDPLRLMERNLESICDECHKALTASSAGKSEARR